MYEWVIVRNKDGSWRAGRVMLTLSVLICAELRPLLTRDIGQTYLWNHIAQLSLPIPLDLWTSAHERVEKAKLNGLAILVKKWRRHICDGE